MFNRPLVGALTFCALSIISPISALASDVVESSPLANQQLINRYGELPLSFESNRGQFEKPVRYVARGASYRVALLSDAVIAQFGTGHSAKDLISVEHAQSPANVRIQFVDADPNASVVGESLLPGTSNYFKGNRASEYLTDIPNFARVRFNDVYPGIDVVHYGNGRQLEYDFVVAPGGNPQNIRLNFEGAKGSLLNSDGDIVLQTDAGDFIQKRPVAYQDVAGRRAVVDAQYVEISANQYSVSLGNYDQNLPLVIDPVFSYSTYLGGSAADWGMAIAVDSAGNSYLTGMTLSSNFPTVNYYDRALGSGDQDVFVAKLNASGTALVYSTFLGGSKSQDNGFGIAVDSSGSAYVTGITNGSDFPTTSGAYQAGIAGGGSFVTKLSAAGNALVYSTYIRNAMVNGLVLNGSQNAVIVGAATSAFLTTSAAFQKTSSFSAGYTGFVLKLNSTGSAPVFSTFLGGNGSSCPASCSGYVADTVNAVALDANENVYVVGQTGSNNFPTVQAYQASARALDAFAAKLDPNGSSLLFSTYLGGSNTDNAIAVAVDGAGSPYVVGYSLSTDFPTKDPFQATNPGNTVDGASRVGFITKLSPDGRSLAYSSYIGGGCGTPGGSFCFSVNMGDSVNAVAVDSAGHAFLAGTTSGGTTRFPLFDSFDPAIPAGGQALFVAEVSRSGSALLYSAALSSSADHVDSWLNRAMTAGSPAVSSPTTDFDDNGAAGVALGASGDLFVIGNSTVSTFRTTPGVLAPTYRGGAVDAVVFRLSANNASASLSSSQNPVTSDVAVTLTANISNASGGGVIFYDGFTSLGTVPLASGIATLTRTLPAGIRRLTAIYRNGTIEADSSTVNVVVNQPELCN